MSIQKNRLNSREQGIATVQMTPAGLNHSDFRVGKEMDGPFKQILFGNEIGIEDAKELALCGSESLRKCSSLKAGSICAMDPLDIETALAQLLGTRCGNFACLIR